MGLGVQGSGMHCSRALWPGRGSSPSPPSCAGHPGNSARGFSRLGGRADTADSQGTKSRVGQCGERRCYTLSWEQKLLVPTLPRVMWAGPAGNPSSGGGGTWHKAKRCPQGTVPCLPTPSCTRWCHHTGRAAPGCCCVPKHPCPAEPGCLHGLAGHRCAQGCGTATLRPALSPCFG